MHLVAASKLRAVSLRELDSAIAAAHKVAPRVWSNSSNINYQRFWSLHGKILATFRIAPSCMYDCTGFNVLGAMSLVSILTQLSFVRVAVHAFSDLCTVPTTSSQGISKKSKNYLQVAEAASSKIIAQKDSWTRHILKGCCAEKRQSLKHRSSSDRVVRTSRTTREGPDLSCDLRPSRWQAIVWICQLSRWWSTTPNRNH